MAIFLGLDPGLANTGYGLVEVQNGKILHLTHGVFKTDAGCPQGERLGDIYRGLMALLKEFSPSAAGIEALYFAKNRTSAIPVAETRGILLLALHQREIPSFEFPPQEIKKALTGNGRAQKQQVQEMVRLLLRLEEIPKSDHASDALGAAICCYHNQGPLRSF